MLVINIKFTAKHTFDVFRFDYKEELGESSDENDAKQYLLTSIEGGECIKLYHNSEEVYVNSKMIEQFYYL